MIVKNPNISILKHFWSQYFIDIIFVLTLLLCVVKLTYNLETFADIELFDESVYLYNGITIPEQGLPDRSYGPLYSVWYYLLSKLSRNSIELFYLNYKLMILLPPVLVYLYQRTLRISAGIAFISSFLFLNSKFLNINPRPTHFALILLLVSLILLNPFKVKVSKKFNDVFLSIAFLCLSFARPEYFLAFVLGVSYYFYQILKSWSRSQTLSRILKDYSKSLLALLILSALVIAILGIPFISNKAPENRNWLAFCQHFSYLWLVRNPSIDLNPYTDCDIIVSKVFGDVDTLSAALFANPQEFLTHVFYNVLSYFSHYLSAILFDFQDYGAVFNRTVRRVELLFLVGILGYIFIHYKNKQLSANLSIDENLKISYLVVVITTFTASIFVNPRFHYLVIQSALTFTLIAYLVNQTKLSNYFRNKNLWVTIAVIASLLLTPNLARGWCLTQNFCPIERVGNESLLATQVTPLKTVKTISFIQSLNLPSQQKINFLEAEGGIAFYLGNNYSYVPHYFKNDNFNQFLENQNINLILVNSKLVKDRRYRDDSEFQDLRQNPQKFGFRETTIPETQEILLIAETL
jgi:hypothetical protein